MYEYHAEYVSKVNGNHYLNVDLGFGIWEIIEIEIVNEHNLVDLKFNDRLKIITEKIGRRPNLYRAIGKLEE